MNIRHNHILRKLAATLLCCVCSCAFTACEDDFKDYSAGIPEGIGTISLQMDFAPLAEGLTQSRATVAPDGDAINGIKDLCILFYDKDGNLLDDYVYYYSGDTNPTKPEGLPESRFLTGKVFDNVDRNPGDASNGQLAQTQSMTGTFNSIKVPFGQYTIIGVANLGNGMSSNYATTTTTYDELFNNTDNDVSTIDKVRDIRLKWDASSIANNAEMFGCFTADGQTSGEAADFFNDKTLPSVIVNKDGMKLTSWLRRAASKVTIEFDGTNLRENIWIHLKSVTIKDIPMGCSLGRKHMVTNGDSLIPVSSHHIDFAPEGKEDDSNFESWPVVVSKTKYPENAHGETVKSLFFYENMQGKGKDKRQYPELGDDGKPTGNVADSEIKKDNKPYGTYIEVEAFYRSRADNTSSHGRIIYRFMLGKDTETDYNAERNYHYKLTLCFNGNANDYDWHIDYNEDPGIKVPIPYYYIPYMYNQSMTFPVTIIGEITGELEAKITRSDWGPSTKEDPGKPVSGFEYYQGKVTDDGPWHGFLSLRRAPGDTNDSRDLQTSIGVGYDGNGNPIINSIGEKEYKYNHWVENPTYGYGTLYNHAYWDGHGDEKIFEKVNPRGVREYDPTPGMNKGDDVDGTYSVTVEEKNGKKYTTFNIPLYSREINLVKTAGYRGNNPYVGYYRYAEIEFTATVNGVRQTVTSKVLQVPRIVNPKGIYRRWNNTAPFNVHLMRLDSENETSYTPVTSDGGPWSAEIEYITDGGGWLAIDGVMAVGQQIHGSTGSEIQFDVTFKSTTGSSEKVRCAVIKVLYHNQTCTHRIMVRQGYEPVVIGNGSIKWHVANLDYYDSDTNTAYEGASPLEEGSLFRCGNVTQAIASTNNRFEDEYGRKDSYILAPSNLQKKATWDEIKSDMSNAFKNFKPTCQEGGRTARVATYNDFNALRTSCEFGAGVLYGDDATETSKSTAVACGYATYNSDNKGYGMRGWFVYNPSKGGMNLFFPIGVAGNGHRKHGVGATGFTSYTNEPQGTGVLRYAARSELMPLNTPTANVEYRPLLYTMYTQRGAIYWLAGLDANNTAWDINYSTFDFNTYGYDATKVFTDSDAAFIRLVED